MRYLCHEGEQKTFLKSKYSFRMIDFFWRYRLLPLPGKLGYLVANYLYQYGIHTLKKDAYTLVLQKL